LDIIDAFTLLGISGEEPKVPLFPNAVYQLWITRADPETMDNFSRLMKEELEATWAKWQESDNRTGACMVLACDCYWPNEENPGFGVMAFPSIEARQEHCKDLQALKWLQYIKAFTLLGIERSEES
jgi:hypothetical protein